MDLSRFECQRCQECCKQLGDVYLEQGLEERVAAYLRLEIRDFVNRYCDMPVKPRLILKKTSEDHCIFLTETGCSIYPVRPRQCRDFPLKWNTPASFKYCAGLKALQS